jgi:hypothetical protein
MSTFEGNIQTVSKKRGRKSKKDIAEANSSNLISGNIVVNVDETNQLQEIDCNDKMVKSYDNSDDDINRFENTVITLTSDKPLPKKRGRKPKGGKIIHQNSNLISEKEQKPNVILHLKCSFKDLASNNLSTSSVTGFSFSNSNLTFDLVNNDTTSNEYSNNEKSVEYEGDDNECNDYDIELNKNNDNDIRETWKKLKILEYNLHNNCTENKKSACFWDTCEFDNPAIHIPKFFMNGMYHVYGCFCSPECAVAHLMEENIDSSVKFERYQLMNHLYSKIYNYDKNIKPAPNPYYMLEKYYGNLNIQEYRSLLKNERLFLIVDKPLTRTMPELHEDNDDFIINNKTIPSNTYHIKKKLQKKQTKTNILSERFGLVHN